MIRDWRGGGRGNWGAKENIEQLGDAGSVHRESSLQIVVARRENREPVMLGRPCSASHAPQATRLRAMRLGLPEVYNRRVQKRVQKRERLGEKGGVLGSRNGIQLVYEGHGRNLR